MKWDLYKLGDVGIIYNKDSNISSFSFWWPTSERFKKHGLACEMDETEKLFSEKYIMTFDSFEKIQQWLFETYFEFYL